MNNNSINDIAILLPSTRIDIETDVEKAREKTRKKDRREKFIDIDKYDESSMGMIWI